MKYFLLFLLLCTSVHALEPLDAATMEARVQISNTVAFVPDGIGFRIDEATGRLTWFPRENWLQEVRNLTVTPQARVGSESVNFLWKTPTQAESFGVDAVILTRNAIVPVREKIPFPLAVIPDETEKYLAPGEITDTNADIQRLAQSLVSGKTDAYEAVFALADWTTNNVNYSLASVGQPAVQKSSQVLVSRYGKCDELTSLFISMNRAVGIPARFVAGYAYTNSERFSSPWGGHGWAEVWLPGQGWIPYDVTYGQYGYLDAGHVALKTAPDAKETSIDFTAKGDDFDILTTALNITVTPLRMTEQNNPAINITLATQHMKVGFGSAVLVLATVANNRDYYVSSRVDLGKTTGISPISQTHYNLLLRPGASRTLPFLVQLDDGMERGYQYTFPITVYSRLGAKSSLDISSNEDAPVYDRSSYVQEFARYAEDEPLPASFSVTCRQRKQFYVGSQVQQECTAWGATTDTLRICLNETCRDQPLISGEFTLLTQDDLAGVYTRTYTATSGMKTVRFFVTSRTISAPQVLASLTAPETATPQQQVSADLVLNHTGSIPRNLTASLRVHRSTSFQYLEQLDAPASFTFTFPGTLLRPGENNVTATMLYSDELGAQQTTSASTIILLEDVGLFDRINFILTDAMETLLDVFR